MLPILLRVLLALLLLRLLYRWFLYPLVRNRRTRPGPASPPRNNVKLKKHMDLTGLDVEDATFEDLKRKK